MAPVEYGVRTVGIARDTGRDRIRVGLVRGFTGKSYRVLGLGLGGGGESGELGGGGGGGKEGAVAIMHRRVQLLLVVLFLLRGVQWWTKKY